MTTQKKPLKQRRHIVDAKGRSLGRVATDAARFLQGKNSPAYAKHQDGGDWVEIRNLKEAKFTGRKLGQKVYFRYSGYPGGITSRALGDLWETKPQQVIRNMVFEMLPSSSLRKKWIKRLIIKNS